MPREAVDADLGRPPSSGTGPRPAARPSAGSRFLGYLRSRTILCLALLTLGFPYTIPLVIFAAWFFVRFRRVDAPTPTVPIPPGVLAT